MPHNPQTSITGFLGACICLEAWWSDLYLCPILFPASSRVAIWWLSFFHMSPSVFANLNSRDCHLEMISFFELSGKEMPIRGVRRWFCAFSRAHLCRTVLHTVNQELRICLELGNYWPVGLKCQLADVACFSGSEIMNECTVARYRSRVKTALDASPRKTYGIGNRQLALTELILIFYWKIQCLRSQSN